MENYLLLSSIFVMLFSAFFASVDAWKSINLPKSHPDAVTLKYKNRRSLILLLTFIAIRPWWSVGMHDAIYHVALYSFWWWFSFDIVYNRARVLLYKDNSINWYYMGNIDNDDSWTDLGFMLPFAFTKGRDWTLKNQIWPWMLQMTIKISTLVFLHIKLF